MVSDSWRLTPDPLVPSARIERGYKVDTKRNQGRENDTDSTVRYRKDGLNQYLVRNATKNRQAVDDDRFFLSAESELDEINTSGWQVVNFVGYRTGRWSGNRAQGRGRERAFEEVSGVGFQT